MSLNRRPVGFLVWNPTRNLPTVQHDTLERAEAEAERLRAENPDEMFWVMSPIRASINSAKAFSDGKAEGLAQAHAEIMLAESRADQFSERLRVQQFAAERFADFSADAGEHQATAADCLLWFDGFNAAHAHRETYERPRTPDREKLRDLNAALQRLIARTHLDDMEIPF